MKSRLAAFCFTALLILMPHSLAGQSYAEYGSGSSSVHATFNPSAPPPVPPRLPQTGGGQITIQRLPVIPANQYQELKSVPARDPISIIPSTTAFSPSGDPIVTPPQPPLKITPTLSFEGIQQTIYEPPSPNIAAGPEDIIQVVNSTVARYTKTGQQTNLTDLTQWFNTGNILSTVCFSGSCVFGDVSIRYDQMQGHFLMTLEVLDRNDATSYLLISVSNGATYASGWTNWALNERLDGSTITNNWADFPQVGFDNAAVYVTSNQFGLIDFVFKYAKVRILKKTDLYNPAATFLPYQDIFNLKNGDGTTASTLQVPQLRGRTQVGTSTGVMINASDVTNANYLTLWQINNPTSTTPTVTRVTLGNIWPYSYPTSAPQLGSTFTLDTGPSSFNATYMRDGLLYGAQNAGYPGEPDTVTYSVVDVIHSKVTLQQRWLNGNFFYPALDVPATIGPGNTSPNNSILGSTTSLTTGALTFAGVTNVKSGEDFYTGFSGTNPARWGDYFGGAIDPTTGGLWVSGEYAKPRGLNNAPHWGSWNAFFPWQTSQAFNDVDQTSANFNYINIMKLWNVTKGCSTTPSLYCPTDALPRSALAVFVIRSIYGDTFTYPTTPIFADVPATDPNFSYIQKLAEQGITKGCGVNPARFCPNDIATRQQAATFVIAGKMAGLFGNNFSFPATPYFSDVPADNPAFSFIQKFREMGYTNGCATASFCPDMQLTREMAAVFIVRAFFN
jgi:hypothetical protein